MNPRRPGQHSTDSTTPPMKGARTALTNTRTLRLARVVALCFLPGLSITTLTAWIPAVVWDSSTGETRTLETTYDGAWGVDAIVIDSPWGQSRQAMVSRHPYSTSRCVEYPELIEEKPPPLRYALWRASALNKKDFVCWIETGSGFPFMCFYKWQELDAWRGLDPTVHGAIPLPDITGSPTQAAQVLARGLPYLPLWPQLIANTLFWSTLWGAALFVPGGVRRRARRKRGLCMKCGYDLSGSGGACPECGSERPSEP